MRSQKLLLCSLALFCVGISFGCKKLSENSVTVPEPYQSWLAGYFDALKAKDTEKLKDLSGRLSARDQKRMPANTQEMMRDSRKKIFSQVLDTIGQKYGEFQSYSVVSCKVTPVAMGSAAADMIGEGDHLEIICKSKYSNATVAERFVLYKGPEDPEVVMEAHSVTASP